MGGTVPVPCRQRAAKCLFTLAKKTTAQTRTAWGCCLSSTSLSQLSPAPHGKAYRQWLRSLRTHSLHTLLARCASRQCCALCVPTHPHSCSCTLQLKQEGWNENFRGVKSVPSQEEVMCLVACAPLAKPLLLLSCSSPPSRAAEEASRQGVTICAVGRSVTTLQRALRSVWRGCWRYFSAGALSCPSTTRLLINRIHNGPLL